MAPPPHDAVEDAVRAHVSSTKTKAGKAPKHTGKAFSDGKRKRAPSGGDVKQPAKEKKRRQRPDPESGSSDSSSSSSSDNGSASRAAHGGTQLRQHKRPRGNAAAAAAALAPASVAAAPLVVAAPPGAKGADAAERDAKLRRILRKLDAATDPDRRAKLGRLLSKVMRKAGKKWEDLEEIRRAPSPPRAPKPAPGAPPPPAKPAIQFSLASGRKRTPTGAAHIVAAPAALTNEELARRGARAQRFAADAACEGEETGPTPAAAAAAAAAAAGPSKAAVAAAAAATRLRASKRAARLSAGEGGGADSDADAGDGAGEVGPRVFGTSEALERTYLRLTRAPLPWEVRPPAVLDRSLAHVKARWADGCGYRWAWEQLKSIRQDLTVQRVRGALAVAVYETHARVAIEAGDLPEFRQCLAVLRRLYSEGLAVTNAPEFEAYGVLFAAAHGQRLLGQELAAVPEHLLPSSPVRHALRTVHAVRMGDYVSFLELYDTAPRMAPYLMDALLPGMRAHTLRALVTAYAPQQLPLAWVARQLGVEEREAADVVRAQGAVVDARAGVLDTRASRTAVAGPARPAGDNS